MAPKNHKHDQHFAQISALEWHNYTEMAGNTLFSLHVTNHPTLPKCKENSFTQASLQIVGTLKRSHLKHKLHHYIYKAILEIK